MKTIKNIGFLILFIGLNLSSCNQKEKTGATDENKHEELETSEKSNDKQGHQLLNADIQEVTIEDIKEMYDNHLQIKYLKQDTLFYYFSINQDAKYCKLKISEIILPSEIVKYEDNTIQPFIRKSEYTNDYFVKYKTVIVKYKTLTELYESKDDNIGNKENPFFGIIYRYIESDIPYFKMNKTGVWSGGEGYLKNGIEYLIEVANNGNNNVVILSKKIKTNRGYLYYSILDTINIDLKMFQNKDYDIGIDCSAYRIGNINRPDIIAIFIYEDKEYYDKILKAWHINIEKGIIEKHEDNKNIRCINDGYGA